MWFRICLRNPGETRVRPPSTPEARPTDYKKFSSKAKPAIELNQFGNLVHASENSDLRGGG